MKKILVSILVLIMIGVHGYVFAGPLDKFKKDDSSKESKKIDIEGLTAREVVVKTKVLNAEIAFAGALIEIQTGAGNKESAEKLKTARENARAKKEGTEDLKVLVAEVNKAVDELDKIDLQAKMDASYARKNLGKSILYLGAGTLLDISASNDAKNLLAEATDALKAVQASPMTYGLSSVTKVKSVVDTTKFIAENIPSQANSIQKITGKLIDYAKANKIEVPSQAELEKKSKEMEKE